MQQVAQLYLDGLNYTGLFVCDAMLFFVRTRLRYTTKGAVTIGDASYVY